MTVLELRNVTAVVGPETVLRDVTLVLMQGDVVLVRGRSGVGKTTLARIAALLAEPASGQVIFLGRSVVGSGDGLRADLRLRHIGYVDQFHTLLPMLTLIENVALPLRILGVPRAEALAMAENIMKELGLGDVLWRYPGEVSGGQKQRAAIARALIKAPKLFVGDEPFSNLDDETAELVFSVIREVVSRGGGAALITTTDLLTDYGVEKDYCLVRGQLREGCS